MQAISNCFLMVLIFSLKKQKVWKFQFLLSVMNKNTMRKGIDYIGVGVGAVLFNREGKIFLSKRGKKSRNERGKWECPGGALEFGESFEDTIQREMEEEFGIKIVVI